MKSFKDKNNILPNIQPGDSLSLELGCGESKLNKESIAIDLIEFPEVDIVGDIYEVLQNIPSESVRYIFSSHVFEHLENLPIILNEIERVLQADGELDVIVPHFSNSFFYSDPTHTKFFGLYTFSYFFHSSIFARSLPSYAVIKGMELIDVKLIFKSYKPHYISHAIRKTFQVIFNLSRYMQEIYEESFVNFISCYEVQFRVKKSKLR